MLTGGGEAIAVINVLHHQNQPLTVTGPMCRWFPFEDFAVIRRGPFVDQVHDASLKITCLVAAVT